MKYPRRLCVSTSTPAHHRTADRAALVIGCLAAMFGGCVLAGLLVYWIWIVSVR